MLLQAVGVRQPAQLRHLMFPPEADTCAGETIELRGCRANLLFLENQDARVSLSGLIVDESRLMTSLYLTNHLPALPLVKI